LPPGASIPIARCESLRKFLPAFPIGIGLPPSVLSSHAVSSALNSVFFSVWFEGELPFFFFFSSDQLFSVRNDPWAADRLLQK